jgi:hypothetical protein
VDESARKGDCGVSFLPALTLSLVSLAGIVSPGTTRAQPGVDRAYELARFLNSDDRADQLWEQLFSAMPALMMEAPETAELMRTHPDMMKRGMKAIWPQLTAELRAELPSLWEKIAAVYRSRLTPEEMSRLLDYYSSPANVKLTRELLRRVDMARAVDGATGQVDSDATKAMLTQAYPLALASLAPSERQQVVRFKASPLAVKYATVRGDLTTARTSWMEEVMPMALARLEKQIDGAAAQGKLD